MLKQENKSSIRNDIERLQKISPSCKNCRENKQAEKPFRKMTKLQLTPLATKVTHAVAKEYGINESCFVCLSIHSFMEKTFDEQMKILADTKHD